MSKQTMLQMECVLIMKCLNLLNQKAQGLTVHLLEDSSVHLPLLLNRDKCVPCVEKLAPKHHTRPYQPEVEGSCIE